MEWNETVMLSSSSIELFVMSAHTMVDTSTAGTRPLDLPITGVYYHIPEVHDEDTSWASSQQDHHRSSDHAANTAEPYGEQPESEMEDDTSVTVETGHVSIPSQIHQLATLLHNILLSDMEYNAPILEKLETPPADPNANPIQLYTASDLAHLASHLSITAQTLSQHAQNQELDDISKISD